MLYQLLYSFSDSVSGFNVFRYITFRTFLSFLTAFFVCWLLGPHFIRQMVKRQVGQTVRDDGPQSHLKKAGTPTMGGALILLSVLVPSLLWVDLGNPLVLASLFIMFTFGLIGYYDDRSSVKGQTSKGLSGRLRLGLEILITAVVTTVLIKYYNFSTELSVPFFKDFSPDLGWFYVPFACLVVAGCANAVNLTDGLDGLAIAPVIIATTTFLVLSYVSGHFVISEYLQLQFVQGAGELTPVSASVIAAGLGFLWYNSYPAQVFMGDVGSLSLGGFLGAMALMTKNELLLAIVGGVFVVEALSVITQVVSFKLTGKRVFRMAPLHHHYELKGIDEPKLIVRFWIVSILLAVLSLSTLKLR